jgi:hypothetical protein
MGGAYSRLQVTITQFPLLTHVALPGSIRFHRKPFTRLKLDYRPHLGRIITIVLNSVLAATFHLAESD